MPQVLDVSNNRLRGPLPDGLYKASGLVELDLSSNALTSILPSSWSRLVNLVKLRASYNHLQVCAGPIAYCCHHCYFIYAPEQLDDQYTLPVYNNADSSIDKSVQRELSACSRQLMLQSTLSGRQPSDHIWHPTALYAIS